FTIAIVFGSLIEVCAQGNADGAEVLPKRKTKAEQENRKIILFNFEKFNRGDTTAAAEDWSEDISNHGQKVGRSGIKMVLDDLFRTFPDARFDVQNAAVDGEMVVVRALFRGTHRGKGQLPVNGGMLVGVEPTGKSFAVEHSHWFRVRDGKIIEHYATRDDIGMMQQLGLSPQVTLGR
ncbi:MAG TPA: ester cyclase, partial [Pyrinomonadaceae bacterium]|nr:ester cyclase [Pyrinomonadaceae bacterium]